MQIVFDSSSLISVGQSCLIEVLHGLHDAMNAEFVIPKSVFREAVRRPLRIRRFELNAVRLGKAVDEKWLHVVGLQGRGSAEEIMRTANSCFYIRGKPVALLQRGEVDALALALQLKAAALVIDERTARMLVEAPFKLRDLMQSRHMEKIAVDRGKAESFGLLFKGLSIVRSVELIALAFELGLLGRELQQSKQALHAALYAAKYSGCAVSSREIEQFLKGF